MKISNILIILSIAFAVSCTPKKEKNDHGHEHKAGEEHVHEDVPVQQEAFTVKEDAAKTEATHDAHKHDATTHTHDNTTHTH